MAIALRSGNGNGAIVEMNTTPLIDVLLVLLVMLILTIPIQTHAVKIDLPHTPSNAPPPRTIQFEVDFDGTVLWNGVPVRDRATLNTYLATEGRMPLAEQAEVRVRANRLAKYGTVASILADAQRAGVSKIGFTGYEQYAD